MPADGRPSMTDARKKGTTCIDPLRMRTRTRSRTRLVLYLYCFWCCVFGIGTGIGTEISFLRTTRSRSERVVPPGVVRALESPFIIPTRSVRGRGKVTRIPISRSPLVARKLMLSLSQTLSHSHSQSASSEAPSFSPLAAAELHRNLTRALEHAVVVTIDDDNDDNDNDNDNDKYNNDNVVLGFGSRLHCLLDVVEGTHRKSGAVPRVRNERPAGESWNATLSRVREPAVSTSTSISTSISKSPSPSPSPSHSTAAASGIDSRKRLRAWWLRWRQHYLFLALGCLGRWRGVWGLGNAQREKRPRSPATRRRRPGTKRHLALLLACVLGGMAGLRPANLTLPSGGNVGAILYHERVVHSACHETVASFSSVSLPGGGPRRARWKRYALGWHHHQHQHPFHECARVWIRERRKQRRKSASDEEDAKANVTATAGDLLRGTGTGTGAGSRH